MYAFIEIEGVTKIFHPGGVPSFVEPMTDEEQTAVSALVAELGYRNLHKITADLGSERLLIWPRPGVRPFVVNDGRFVTFVEMVQGEHMSLADFKAQQAAVAKRRELVERLFASDVDIEALLEPGEVGLEVAVEIDIVPMLQEIEEIPGVGKATLAKIAAILEAHLNPAEEGAE